MNLPIEVVVELLMANYTSNGMGVWVHQVGRKAIVVESSVEELRTKVREYLLTLAPKPKLLSECEECPKRFAVGWRDVVTGKEGRISKDFDTIDECNEFCDTANSDWNQLEYFPVPIQPVEVQ